MLIFAAHQDDGVIQAGGVAIQNIKLGGRVNVVYLTIPSDPQQAAVRKAEANNAWSELGGDINLTFLNFISSRDWSKEKINKAESKIKSIISRFNPDTIYIPLDEGGQIEHDLLNRMVLKILKNHEKITVYQSAEYNPYYILGNTPTKIIWFMIRLLPFVPYIDANYGLVPSNQMKLLMTKEDFQMKIHMLLKFVSQKDTIPISQFGYVDIFDSTGKKPSFLIKISGKYLSTWTAASIILLLITIGDLGCILAFHNKLNKKLTAIILIISWLIIMFVLYSNFRLFIEELIYVVTLLLGITLGVVLNSISKSTG